MFNKTLEMFTGEKKRNNAHETKIIIYFRIITIKMLKKKTLFYRNYLFNHLRFRLKVYWIKKLLLLYTYLSVCAFADITDVHNTSSVASVICLSGIVFVLYSNQTYNYVRYMEWILSLGLSFLHNTLSNV